MNALDKIYTELKSGTVFGDICHHRMGGTYFWHVLWIERSEINPGKRYICWRHAGQSANLVSKKNLKWILEVIFKMSPAEFLFRYTNYEEYCRIDECYKEAET